MTRGPKRSGLSPYDIEAGMAALGAAYAFLIRVCKTYPIDFDPNAPYGAASSAIKAVGAGRHGDDGRLGTLPRTKTEIIETTRSMRSPDTLTTKSDILKGS